MKLAIVVNSFPKISETFIFNKIAGLSKCGIDVNVITHNSNCDETFFKDKTSDLKLKITLSPLAIPYPKLLIQVLLSLPLLITIWPKLSQKSQSIKEKIKFLLLLLPLYKEKIDIIHFEYSGLAIQYLDVFDLLPAKTVVSCRGAAEQIKPLYDQNRRTDLTKLFQKVDLVHCVSHSMQKTLEKYDLPKQKAFVNPPSIDTSFFKRTQPYRGLNDSEELTIVSTGRLHWKKGFNYALGAIYLLKNKNIRLTYNIIGDGIELESLSFIVDKLGLNKMVHFKGALSSNQVKTALENAHIFLLPSLSEGLSNAALEAMSMEIPTISTKAGGMEEAIENGHNGFIVDLFSPMQIACSIEEAINNSEKCIEIGRKARETVINRFNIEKQIATFIDNYDKLLQ